MGRTPDRNTRGVAAIPGRAISAHGWLWWLGWLALIAALLVLVAGWLGREILLLDLANLVALPTALAALGLAILLAWRARRWVTRAVPAGIGGFALFCALSPLSSAPDCGPQAPLLRVAFLNTQSSDASAPIIDWLAREQPDVVAFAELLSSDIELRTALDQLYPYQQSCMQHDRCSTMIYSRLEPLASQGLSGGGDAQNRKALSAARMDLLPAPDAPLTIMAAHLSHPLPLGKQDAELIELESHIDAPENTVIVGDFNATPRMHVLRRFAERNALSVNSADRSTWPVDRDVPFPLIQIDQMLSGDGWAVTGLRTSGDLGSDHRGIVSDLCRLR